MKYGTWAAALGIAASSIGRVAAHQPATFHADTRLVVLLVTVTNGDGDPVTTLDRGAFRVYENGRPQTISLFRREDVAISLGLIIDNSGSMRSLRPTMEAAALAFVRASNPLDEIFVLNFADMPRIDVPFTSDPRLIEGGVTRLDSIGGTAIRDAILVAGRYLNDHAAHDRRALLLLTDGRDNASGASRAELHEFVDRSGVAIFAVTLLRAGGSTSGGTGDAELQELADLTGGSDHRVGSISDVNRIILEIARQLRNAYTIAYTPANEALDGTYRSVRVEVTRPRGLTARTRPGYWAMPAH